MQTVIWILLLYMLQMEAQPHENVCQSKETCQECIQTEFCLWCKQPENNFKGNSRCLHPRTAAIQPHSCPEEYMYSPDNLYMILQNLKPSSQIQLRPQHVEMKLRLHQPLRIQARFRKAEGTNQPSVVELKDNATEYINVKYYTNCLDKWEPLILSNKCENVLVGEEIDFSITLELQQCPKDSREWFQTIAIYPIGAKENLFIKVEMICSCPCEYAGSMDYEENSPKCKGHGTYKCGVCECDFMYFGKHCECAVANLQTYPGCIPPGSDQICSGRGTCLCNQCGCDARENYEEIINGEWCECDNFSCHRYQNKICGGHGRCECGKCVCEVPWIGNACECYNVNNTCYPPFKDSPQLCDGHGDCICGACQCHMTPEGGFTGRYCEECPGCNSKCIELEPCVLCQMYRNGPYNEEICMDTCRSFTPISVKTVQADEANDEFLCVGSTDNCKYEFTYKQISDDQYSVKASELNC